MGSHAKKPTSIGFDATRTPVYNTTGVTHTRSECASVPGLMTNTAIFYEPDGLHCAYDGSTTIDEQPYVYMQSWLQNPANGSFDGALAPMRSGIILNSSLLSVGGVPYLRTFGDW
jgi:hypothetical protein